MSKKIQINIHFKDLKRQMLICIFTSMPMDREKEWGNYKMEVVVREGGRYLLTKLIRKRK